jgi:MATE family multidrug resistance protein
MRSEIRPLLTLAVPLVVGELGWMTMGLVDTMMVGRVSKEALGGVSVGSVLYFTISVAGIGTMFGLDTLVSQSFGARRIQDCHRSLVAALWLSVLLTPVVMAASLLWIPWLPRFGVRENIVREAAPYLAAVVWGTLPLLLYNAMRRYLQSMDIVKPVMFSLLSANLVNVVGNWVLIFGHWGFPAMGAEGAGWATCFSRGYMALVLVAYIVYREKYQPSGLLATPWRPNFARMWQITALGGPAAIQIVFEVGVFAAATTLLGRLEAEYLAAHQIAMNAASYTYMVPLGLSAAAAVRVGQAIGRGDPEGARCAGWTGIAVGASVMSLGAVAFLLLPRQIARLFSTDSSVIAASVALLAVAAMFQLFDGTQVVATGALRGAGDTRTPAFCHLVGYWFLGLPLGYWLCFHGGFGATGMWIGLCAALITIGLVLGVVWHRKSRQLTERQELVTAD